MPDVIICNFLGNFKCWKGNNFYTKVAATFYLLWSFSLKVLENSERGTVCKSDVLALFCILYCLKTDSFSTINNIKILFSKWLFISVMPYLNFHYCQKFKWHSKVYRILNFIQFFVKPQTTEAKTTRIKSLVHYTHM